MLLKPYRLELLLPTLYTTRNGLSSPKPSIMHQPQPTFERAVRRAGSTDLLTILRRRSVAPHPGRSELYPRGSIISEALSETSQKDAIHQDLPYAAITQLVSNQVGFRIARDTGQNIFQTHHQISKYTPVIKPELLAFHKAARVELAEWAIPKLLASDLFAQSFDLYYGHSPSAFRASTPI